MSEFLQNPNQRSLLEEIIRNIPYIMPKAIEVVSGILKHPDFAELYQKQTRLFEDAVGGKQLSYSDIQKRIDDLERLEERISKKVENETGYMTHAADFRAAHQFQREV